MRSIRRKYLNIRGKSAVSYRCSLYSLLLTLACICLISSSAFAVDISSCMVISSSGTYTLTANITDSTAANCIQITSSNVTLEGAGHTIDGIGTAGARGVYVYNASQRLSNVVIRQLTLTGWNDGIVFQNVDNSTIENNSSTNNQNSGIQYKQCNQ